MLAAVLSLSVVLQRRAVSLFGGPGRQLLAFALLVLLPTVTEVQGNLANLQVWFAIALLVVLVLPAPTTWQGRGAEIGFVVLSVLTGFLAVLLTPAALWGAWRHRTRYVWLRTGILIVGAGVNLAVWATQDRPPAADLDERLETLPVATLKRWGGGMVMGYHLMRIVWPYGWLSIWALPAALLLGLLAYLAWSDRSGPSWVWLFCGVLWFVLGVVSPADRAEPSWVYSAIGGWRYFGLAIAAGMLVLVRGSGRDPVRVWAIVGILACSAAFVTGAYLKAPVPSVEPAQLRAFERCLAESSPRPCVLPIAPEGWTAVVP